MIEPKTKKIGRRLEGTVVSNKMQKTIVVRVERKKKHPKYGKYFTVSKKYKVHCEDPGIKVGDKIIFKECRPMSRTKRWIIV